MPVCQAYAQGEDAGAHFTHEQRVANARFIAHACTSSVALCAIVREQDAEIERLRGLLQDVCDLDSLNDLPDMIPAIKRALAKPTSP